MKLEMTNFQAVAANLVAEGDVCDLACAKPATQPETDTEIAPIIQKLGAGQQTTLLTTNHKRAPLRLWTL
jgi:hypothetical protein